MGAKEIVYIKSPAPTGFVWNANIAAVSSYWNTNMAAVTTCENSLKIIYYMAAWDLISCVGLANKRFFLGHMKSQARNI